MKYFHLLCSIGLLSRCTGLQAADKFVLSFTESTYGVVGWGGTNRVHVLQVSVDGTAVYKCDVGEPTGAPSGEGAATPLRSAGDVSIDVTSAIKSGNAPPVVTFRLTREFEGCGTSPILLTISRVQLQSNGQPTKLGKFKYRESGPVDVITGTSPKNAYNGGLIEDALVLCVGDDLVTADPKEYNDHVIAADRAGHGNDFVVDQGEFGELSNGSASQ